MAPMLWVLAARYLSMASLLWMLGLCDFSLAWAGEVAAGEETMELCFDLKFWNVGGTK